MKEDWISIRNQWPETSGNYLVKDCRLNQETVVFYDGYDWESVSLPGPLKGPLIMRPFIITHWKLVRSDSCCTPRAPEVQAAETPPHSPKTEG